MPVRRAYFPILSILRRPGLASRAGGIKRVQTKQWPLARKVGFRPTPDDRFLPSITTRPMQSRGASGHHHIIPALFSILVLHHLKVHGAGSFWPSRCQATSPCSVHSKFDPVCLHTDDSSFRVPSDIAHCKRFTCETSSSNHLSWSSWAKSTIYAEQASTTEAGDRPLHRETGADNLRRTGSLDLITKTSINMCKQHRTLSPTDRLRR